LTTALPLSGACTGLAQLAGDVTTEIPLQVSLSTDSTASGTLTIPSVLLVELTAVATLTGTLTEGTPAWVALDVARWLETQGVGDVGRTIFVGSLPATSGVFAVIERTGLSGQRSFNGVEFEHPVVEILARGNTYLEAAQLLDTAYRAIPKLVNQKFNGTWYGKLQLLTAPSWVDQDDNGRTILSFEVEVIKALSRAA